MHCQLVEGTRFPQLGRVRGCVDLTGDDVAFQASDDFGFGESLLGSAFGVGGFVGRKTERVAHDDVEGVVGVAVAASVESGVVDAAAAGGLAALPRCANAA